MYYTNRPDISHAQNYAENIDIVSLENELKDSYRQLCIRRIGLIVPLLIAVFLFFIEIIDFDITISIILLFIIPVYLFFTFKGQYDYTKEHSDTVTLGKSILFWWFSGGVWGIICLYELYKISIIKYEKLQKKSEKAKRNNYNNKH
ncbi:MAG: hypothetical protein IIY78_05420 [Clostridia bacterium]|nr:hypothetical protein [Clostridia bacterium]